MTISEEIQHLYANSSRSLVDDMSFIVDNGYVRSGPGYCLMFVALDTYGWIICVAVVHRPATLADLLFHMPYYLPHIGWSRQADGLGEIKWHKTEAVFRHI
jgi:hypothetical protein